MIKIITLFFPLLRKNLVKSMFTKSYFIINIIEVHKGGCRIKDPSSGWGYQGRLNRVTHLNRNRNQAFRKRVKDIFNTETDIN